MLSDTTRTTRPVALSDENRVMLMVTRLAVMVFEMLMADFELSTTLLMKPVSVPTFRPTSPVLSLRFVQKPKKTKELSYRTFLVS